MDERPTPNPNDEYVEALCAMVDAEIAELEALPVYADHATRSPVAGHRRITDHVDALGQRIYTQWDSAGCCIAAWPVTPFGVRTGRLR